MRRVAFICASALLLVACRGDETVAGYGGAEKLWRVVEIDGVAFTAGATMRFPEPGRIAGDAPCNSYAATMTAPYPWFQTGPIAATRRYCPDADAETAFFSALAEMTLSEVLGDTMILSTPEGRSIILKSDG